MNPSQIEAFLTTVRLRSLSKAASSLFVSQSTISQRIHAIENEYGIILLNRDRGVKSITLTSAGERFYQIALQFETLQSEAKNLKTSSGEITITVGAVDSIHNYIFEDIYKLISLKMPDVRLSIRTYQSNEIYRLIEEREIDIGMPLQERILRDIQVTSLFSEQLVLIQNTNDKSKKKITQNNRLNPKNQIYINWGREYQIWHEKHWGSATNTYIQVDTVTMLNNLLIDPNQWAVVPISIARILQQKKSINVSLLHDAPPDRVCYLVVRENANEFTKHINEIIIQSLPLISEIVSPWGSFVNDINS